MASEANPNRCYTEDTDTASAIIALMRHVNPNLWPVENRGAGAAVFVKPPEEGLEDLLKEASLYTELNTSGRRAFAVVMDAETKPTSAWNRVRQFASNATPQFKNIPQTMPETGLILENENGVNVGLWVMPDNKSAGMLEDWLRRLVPDEHSALWGHAVASVTTARSEFGAGCRDAVLSKAHLHAHLSWQDPPGERIGAAIASKTLDPNSPSALPFVAWFNKVFRL
jgi:hypothetical protein